MSASAVWRVGRRPGVGFTVGDCLLIEFEPRRFPAAGRHDDTGELLDRHAAHAVHIVEVHEMSNRFTMYHVRVNVRRRQRRSDFRRGDDSLQ